MNYIDYMQNWVCTVLLSYCVHKATVIPFTAICRIPCALKHEGQTSSVLSDNWVIMLWPFVLIPSVKSRHVNSWTHLLDLREYYLVSRNQMGKQCCMTIRRSWMQIIPATDDTSCMIILSINFTTCSLTFAIANCDDFFFAWRNYCMDTLSALLAICEEISS